MEYLKPNKQQKRNLKNAKKANRTTSKNLKGIAKKAGDGNTKRSTPSRAEQIAKEAGKNPKRMTSPKGHWSLGSDGKWDLKHGSKRKQRIKDNELGGLN